MCHVWNPKLQFSILTRIQYDLGIIGVLFVCLFVLSRSVPSYSLCLLRILILLKVTEILQGGTWCRVSSPTPETSVMFLRVLDPINCSTRDFLLDYKSPVSVIFIRRTWVRVVYSSTTFSTRGSPPTGRRGNWRKVRTPREKRVVRRSSVPSTDTVLRWRVVFIGYL